MSTRCQHHNDLVLNLKCHRNGQEASSTESLPVTSWNGSPEMGFSHWSQSFSPGFTWLTLLEAINLIIFTIINVNSGYLWVHLIEGVRLLQISARKGALFWGRGKSNNYCSSSWNIWNNLTPQDCKIHGAKSHFYEDFKNPFSAYIFLPF